jgi:hypothetical protein
MLFWGRVFAAIKGNCIAIKTIKATMYPWVVRLVFGCWIWMLGLDVRQWMLDMDVRLGCWVWLSNA